MSAVFAGTYYFLGLLNRSDEAHPRCLAFSREYKGNLVVTEYVLVEVADGLLKPQHRSQAARFIRTVENIPRVKVIPASQALFSRGLQLYTERPDKEWSLTDCISFVVMTEENLREALTGDQDFEQAGFTALLK